MKNLFKLSSFLFIALIATLLTVGCSDKDGDSGKGCWEFTMTTTTSVKGMSVPGYPKTNKSTTKECDLTKKDAEKVVKTLTTETTTSQSGMTITVKTTCAKKRL